MRVKETIVRYGLAVIGQFFIAIGVAIAVASDLGQGPLPGPAYAVSLAGCCGMSLGTWTFLINCLLIVVQLLLLRRKFKISSLMQVVASFVFGLLVDLSCWMFLGWLVAHTLWQRVLLAVISCLVTAFGLSIEVVANAWMLSVEMTIKAICEVTGAEFRHIKMLVDFAHVAASIILCLIFFSAPFGKGEGSVMDFLLVRNSGISVVVGLGTVLAALLVGPMMKLTDPVAKKLTLPIL